MTRVTFMTDEQWAELTALPEVRAACNAFKERITVKCDLENNSAASIDAGLLRIDIAFPAYPWKFEEGAD